MNRTQYNDRSAEMSLDDHPYDSHINQQSKAPHTHISQNQILVLQFVPS
jgi:hypothetical protein